MEARYILTGTNNRDKNMMCSYFMDVKYEVSEMKKIYRRTMLMQIIILCKKIPYTILQII